MQYKTDLDTLASQVEVTSDKADPLLLTFLAELPDKLQLHRLQGLSLENPKETLSTLLEIRASVLRQQQTAQAFQKIHAQTNTSLCYGQNSIVRDNIDRSNIIKH